MNFTSIKITYPNGKCKSFTPSSFEYYSSTNELEHKQDNIIITLNDISKSFIYETDDLTGEITYKEFINIEIQ